MRPTTTVHFSLRVALGADDHRLALRQMLPHDGTDGRTVPDQHGTLRLDGVRWS